MAAFSTQQQRYAEIARRLEIIQSAYDLEEITARDKGPEDITAYYRASDFFYNLIHSMGGQNIHMGLSEDGKFRKEDFLKQAQYIGSLFGPDTRRVLEVGAERRRTRDIWPTRIPLSALRHWTCRGGIF